MKEIRYNSKQNAHSRISPLIVLELLFGKSPPASVIDVGCNTGTWAAAALSLGAKDGLGVEGRDITEDELLIPKSKFCRSDLESHDWNKGRRFELGICLEVWEHLHSTYAPRLVQNLTSLAESVLFSAAAPKQTGDHHVNCQWPEYWRGLFNMRGFSCRDSIRWRIRDDVRIEPWYRQNMFIATRAPRIAGSEPCIKAVVHPDAWWLDTKDRFLKDVENGSMDPA